MKTSKHKNIVSKIGMKIKLLRNMQGLTQDELAEKMGICAGKHIGTIERGETNPSLITIIAVMQALELSSKSSLMCQRLT